MTLIVVSTIVANVLDNINMIIIIIHVLFIDYFRINMNWAN